MVKLGSSASPACTAASRLVQRPKQRQRGGEQKMRDGIIRLASMPRRSHATASASAPSCNLARPANSIHRKAVVSRGERRRASLIWTSVSAAATRKYLARPMKA